ncbi:conserved hypothetical protein [Xenorhabdus nematophila F1]|uniref:Uncharacterized protein n=1 Tax=Xenorhabdus nematophila (strain ATCC 19061 / DSM 3370 / CCUG 14189 / LMG 1036 / NCIMB 9965 / AN6) TaxID=406817 RepID=D3VGR3_XENNA|nr:hypothetical protein XNC1_2440 [Xenorhabdus nematophila ATCC 19061]CCW32524.1 conserved hypothetical protein [Xenorhabdus nematophila F1]CEE90030.1 hypothetical protein XNA1_1100010 [Xenorhabdus nematophila str. Anatoliense]
MVLKQSEIYLFVHCYDLRQITSFKDFLQNKVVMNLLFHLIDILN